MLGYSSTGRDVDVSVPVATTIQRSIKAKPAKTTNPAKTSEPAKPAKSTGTKNEAKNEPNGAAVPVAK